MDAAVKEYAERLSVSALEVANKYGVDVAELHRAFAKYRANNG